MLKPYSALSVTYLEVEAASKRSSAPRLAEQMIIQVALASLCIRPGCNHCIDLAHFDGATVFKMGAVAACFDCGTVIWRFDQVEASKPFFSFAVRTVGTHNLTSFFPQNAAWLIRKLLASDPELLVSKLLSIGLVLSHGSLNFLWAEFRPVSWIVVKQEQVLRHFHFLLQIRLWALMPLCDLLHDSCELRYFCELWRPSFHVLPFVGKMIVIDEAELLAVHVPFVAAAHVTASYEVEVQLPCAVIVESGPHMRLIVRDTVMGQHEIAAVDVVDGDHVTAVRRERVATESFHYRRPT